MFFLVTDKLYVLTNRIGLWNLRLLVRFVATDVQRQGDFIGVGIQTTIDGSLYAICCSVQIIYIMYIHILSERVGDRGGEGWAHAKRCGHEKNTCNYANA